MSEIEKSPVNNKKRQTIILVTVVSALVLLLMYGVGTFVLPMGILYSYQDKNCGSVLSLNGLYTGIYPGFMQDESIYAPVRECVDYSFAASNEEKENWSEAYDGYRLYSTNYPSGLFFVEAHEHSAIVLLNMAEAQIDGQKYDEAVATLGLIVSSYSDTEASADAWDLYPSIYTSWGTGLRESSDFEGAEQVFNQYKGWSQSNQKTEAEAEAQHELALTYMTWGQDLGSQKEFQDALAKFELAASADPESKSNSDNVKAEQRRLYVEWGNDLLEQDQFSAAIETFKLGVSKSDGDNEDGVSDALTNGYIQWAHEYSADEDFLKALEHLVTAEQAAGSEAMKKSVETAVEDTYLAFSMSDGEQAQRAMRAALISVCDRHKKPDLPIFGLNVDSVRFALYGVEADLPKELTAQTPGELHYIACVDEGNNTIETRRYREIVLRFAGGYYFRYVTQYRAELLWYFDLVKIDTLKVVDDTK